MVDTVGKLAIRHQKNTTAPNLACWIIRVDNAGKTAALLSQAASDAYV